MRLVTQLFKIMILATEDIGLRIQSNNFPIGRGVALAVREMT